MKHLLLYFALFITAISTAQQDTIFIQNNLKQVISNEKEQYFFTTKNIAIEEVIVSNFKTKKETNLFYITGWLWVKFTIKNNSNTEHFVLNVSDGHLSGFYLYKPILGGGFKMTAPKQNHPEDGREVFNRLPSFFIDLKKGETQTFYLKINSEDEVTNFNYIIQSYKQYTQFVQTDYLIIGGYLAALLIIIIINIFYFVSLRDTLFLVYANYVFASLFVTVTIEGFIWLYVSDPDVAYHLNFFFLRFWPDSLLFFTMQLVSLKEHRKFLTKICYSFIFYHFIIMGVLDYMNVFNIKANFMAEWEVINWGIAIILICITVISSFKNNKYLFKYYLVAYGVLFLVTAFTFMHGADPGNWLIFEHGMKAGTLIEIVTLSFAVSRRFKLTENDLRLKKEDEQRLTNEVKQLEMNVRKAQMNPHFMFNALSSIEYFIFKNEPQQARNYLNKFAQLMRLTLDNSKENYIQLIDDINALKFYIELEFLRLKTYPHHFEIKLDPEINPDIILVPALLIQPFVENAIWHGLQKKDRAGKLSIELTLQEHELICIIEDDGGGMEKTKPLSNRKSSGIQITKERLNLIHALLKTSSRFIIEDIKDENGSIGGTRVQFNIPYVIGDE